MPDVVLKNQRIIGNYKKPYIIAEVNSSHNGNIDTAKQMVLSAKQVGCDCVKFQSWTADSLYSKTYYDANPIAKRIVQKFSFSNDQLSEIVNYCHDIGVSFSSTPYSQSEVDFLVNRCDVPFIKVASMEINNMPFLEYIAKKGLPVILSTGMADLNEIKQAVSIFEKVGNSSLVLLHCISIYPAPASTIQLNNILLLREEFPSYPIGFSDHTDGTEIAAAATALGACVIEKHLTLDKSKPGMDNNMAIEPPEMENLVKNCTNVYEAMGTKERVVSEAEYEQRKKMRRSVVYLTDKPAGSVLTAHDLGVKRPGTGLPPIKIQDLIGKTLCHDVSSDTMVLEADVLI